ncbi:RrF2 family transcriptional regulator [Pseudonocardia sp.]|uniref:RrF2 family transcriptional regulator n=1 Tax=Pseudonocardia sp. TaxID=60912 RepID=UPI003D09DCD0
MRMGQGVEWTLHVLLAFAWLDDDEPVTVQQLAASHELPVAYLNKQLQALVRASILESLPGARGGFRLARRPEAITLMDVVVAIEGTQAAFRCTEIRQRGAGAAMPAASFAEPCAVHASMQRAELAWRRELAAQTIADLRADADRHAPAAGAALRRALGRTPQRTTT